MQGDPTASGGGLTSNEAQARLAAAGPNEVPEEPPHLVRDFALRFWGPIPWMLEAALALEVALDKVPEAAIILALLLFNAVLAEVQEFRAQDALRLLRHRLRVTARVSRDGNWTTVAARELVPGDRIHLRMGDIVPADCQVSGGEIEVDQSTITGESALVTRAQGTTLYSSSIVRRGEATAEVTATGPRSFYGKTAELVRTARTVSHLEGLLFQVVRYLVTLDVLLALLVLGVALFRGVAVATVLPFVLILLIASVPVAMPATFTIANAVEARRLVDRDVLVTGLTAVQEAASMDVLCADKTGTLTDGQETLGEVVPSGGQDENQLFQLAGAACDVSSQDTVDLAVLTEAKKRGVAPLARSKFLPFDPALKRSEAEVAVGGQLWRVVLGSPTVVAGLSAEPPPTLAPTVARLSGSGARVLAVAAGPVGHLAVRGVFALSDSPRPDAAELVRSLRGMGIRVVMLTGDTMTTAQAVAHSIGLGERFGERSNLLEDPSSYDGFAGIYPEDKYQLVRALQAEGHVVGMTGDGVNDAPALKQAEVGIAVATATDVARASGRLVLTRPGLQGVVGAVEAGRRVYRRMLTWTLNKVSKNIELVLLLTVGFVATGLFVTTPFLILMMVFANDFVSMSVGSDNARISSGPDRWNIQEIAVIAAVVGGAWLAFSFSLLWWALNVGHLGLGQIQTLFFLYLVFSSQGTVLLVRERGRAWDSRPSTTLLVAIVADVLTVSLLAVTGTLMTPIPAVLVATLLGTIAGIALVVDQVKVFVIRQTGAFGPTSRFFRGPPVKSP